MSVSRGFMIDLLTFSGTSQITGPGASGAILGGTSPPRGQLALAKLRTGQMNIANFIKLTKVSD